MQRTHAQQFAVSFGHEVSILVVVDQVVGAPSRQLAALVSSEWCRGDLDSLQSDSAFTLEHKIQVEQVCYLSFPQIERYLYLNPVVRAFDLVLYSP